MFFMDLKEIIDFYKNSTLEELTKEALVVCRKNYGNLVFVRGLLEFSNYCSMDCLYCGIRNSNSGIERFRLESAEIIKIAVQGYDRGFRSFVLQSGEDAFYDVKKLATIVDGIREKTGDEAAITLSCGIFSKYDYHELMKAGANRYLLRFETSDPGLHVYLRNGMPLERRLKALRDLKELGYETGSGFMTGLPGETEETRINNALMCKELELDMVGIGPFIPHPDTPLKNSVIHDIDLVLQSTALVRLMLPEANIPATTATGTLDPEGREKVLCAGANVIMVNITPVEAKKNYLLYPGKICLDEDGMKCLECIGVKIAGTGKVLAMERGNSISWGKRHAG
jgi:biotin synthase